MTAPYLRTAYGYALPPELIAGRPAAERTNARLMVVDRRRGELGEARFSALGDYLRPGDLLVLNDTQVVPARLYGERIDTGGAVELLLTEASGNPGGLQLPPAATSVRCWALGRPGRRLKPKRRFVLEGGCLVAEVLEEGTGGCRLLLLESADGTTPVAEWVERCGHMPLPPYLGRRDDARDRTDYQTVVARHPGAVAAPTAGLHFTVALLAQLEAAGIRRASVTLHVGPGTFQPVEANDIRNHTLQTEAYTVNAATAAAVDATRTGGGRVVAVGTTVVRALESAGAAGGRLRPGAGTTQLFIAPPFEFQVVDALVTNFHLPESSLLMLVAAFGGPELVLRAYAEAVERRYRFYSYGDAMLVV